MKRIVLGILFVLFVFSMSTGVFANVGAESDIAVENDVQLLSDSAIDAEILARINDLYAKVGNTYFNVDHGTGCGDGSDHGCPNCLLSAIINKTWFKNIFGSCSVEQFPESYYGIDRYSKDAYSCLGFSHFAQWYIFKESNSDYVYSQKIGTYSFNNSNIAKYAKIGDNLRLTSGYSSFGGHSAIYIGISSDGTGIDVLDCNFNTTYNCKVRKHTLPFTTYNYVTITRTTNRDSIVPDTEPPTNAKLSVNKQTATIGEIVRFSFSADYAKQYWLQIYKDEARVYSIDLGSSSEYEMSFDTAGEYSAYVSCSNGLGYVDSTWISFIIHNNLPQNATLSLNKSIVEINESVVYSYSADYANQYWLQIFKDDTKLYSIDLGNGTEYEISFETPGVYSAYVSCSNGLGYIDSSWINLIVHNNEPQNAELRLNKSIALIDEPVVFSYSADFANQYWLQIYKDEVSVYSIDLGNSNEYVMSFEEPGEYSAYISCSNSSGYVDSSWINLTVHNNTPDNAKLNTDKSVVFVNEDVIFSYSADYANQYWLQVFKNEERVYSIDLGHSSEYKMSFETPGEYFVYVSCSNKLGYTDSEWISIIVRSESIVIKNNNDEYYVNVNVAARKNANTVIVAGYLFGKLQQTKILQYNDVLTDTTLIGDFDEIRIFSLENQSSIKPICVHETIPSSDFITE